MYLTPIGTEPNFNFRLNPYKLILFIYLDFASLCAITQKKQTIKA